MKRKGFTLIELMVVIGIIALLVGILLPTIRGVKLAAYATVTRSQISRLESAIQAYHSDFFANPGPLSNNEVRGGYRQTSGDLWNPQMSKTELGVDILMKEPRDWISGSENLTLGLLGGLRYTDSRPNGTKLWFDKDAVGGGPFFLNPNKPKRLTPYLNYKPNEISQAGEFFKDEAGRRCLDTYIPEFVDSFNDPLPIMYLRARNGSPGTVGRYQSNPWGCPTQQQYNLDDVTGYTMSQNFPVDGNPGFPPNGHCIGIKFGKYHGLRHYGANGDPGDGYNSNHAKDGVEYFIGMDANTPPKKDDYILISPGKDRIYGTDDDITNFR